MTTRVEQQSMTDKEDAGMAENVESACPTEEQSGVPRGYWTSPKFIGSVVAIVLLANNLFIGYSMPATILTVIDEDIGPDTSIYLATLVDTLIKGVGLLLVGSISDVVGRRYFLIGGQVFGFVGAAVAATAKDVPTLIGANVLIGLGQTTQVLYPLLIQEIVPNRWRGFSQGAISFCVFPTIGLGPAFSRLMVSETALGWRWVYWLNAITVGVSGVLFVLCYFPPNFEQLSGGVPRRDQILKIDYAGFALYSAGLVLVLLALSWGGQQYAWSSATVISCLVVGVAVLVAFVAWEIKAPLQTPLLPMSLFRNRDFVIAVIVGSAGQMSWYALTLLWPKQISLLYTTDNVITGWMSCTTGIALATGEVIMGPFCKRGGRIKMQMYASVILLTTFCGIMALSNENRQDLAIGVTFSLGFCVGWIELITIVTATLVIPPAQIGSGSAFFASTRAVTGTVVSAIYLAIYNGRVSSTMTDEVADAVENAGLPPSSIPELLEAMSNGSSSALEGVPGFSQGVQAAFEAAQKSVYAASFQTVYLTSIAFGGVALIATYFATDAIETKFTDFVNKTVSRSREQSEEHMDKKDIG